MSRPSGFQKPTTLAIEVARHLREAIIKRTVAPGERLNESKLTRELNLSRSPLREAIRILEAEGLVMLEPHRGAYVRTLSDNDLREIFDVRLMFETHALRHGPLTIETLVPLRQAVTEARSALEAANFEQWHQAGVRFHDRLVGLAQNGHLKHLYDELQISLRRYQISLIGIPDQPERSQSAHESILSALEHGDLERGVDLVAEHITSLKEALLKAIAREMAG